MFITPKHNYSLKSSDIMVEMYHHGIKMKEQNFASNLKNKGICILQESEKTDLITDLWNYLSKICSF